MIHAQRKSQMASVVVSFAIHLAAFAVMFFIKLSLPDESLQMVLDSVFSEERLPEEFEHEIEQSNEVATTLNLVESQSLSTALGTSSGGASGAVATQKKVDEAESLQPPAVVVRPAEIILPGAEFAAEELGSGQIKGDVGRVVEGYGPALSQLTQELTRLMREKKLLVVWLFDESESMRDDQQEIREKFHKVYEELGLVAQSDSKLKPVDEVLLTSILSFGDDVHEHTAKPTAKIKDVREAIEKIQIEESGRENMCKAVSAALNKYGPLAQKQGRRLAVIVVSDESGDDGEFIEDTVERAKRLKAPVYILGRYASFGYPYALMTWVDPKYKLKHWLRIRRGPEAPFPELLQTDGLHERWSYESSGFGPYEQVRLALETGGIFFLLPGNEDNISGGQSPSERRYDLLDMKQYLPDLGDRVSYTRARDVSKFRSVQWEVINQLSPELHPELKIQEIHYSVDPALFAQQDQEAFQRALHSLQLFNIALRRLDSVQPLRAKEQSLRWRANYDLIHAQCKAYRVRLFQLLLALDQHLKNQPAPRVVNNRQNNMWNAVRQKEMLPPDPVQVQLTQVNLDELNTQMEEATAEFEAVILNHPRTPWARQAAVDLSVGFGIKLVDGYHDFQAYAQAAKEIKLPTP